MQNALWPRQESNLDLELRKLLYYPLYYEAIKKRTLLYYPRPNGLGRAGIVLRGQFAATCIAAQARPAEAMRTGVRRNDAGTKNWSWFQK